MQDVDRLRPWRQGSAAFLYGDRHMTRCPYLEGTQDHDAWTAGFLHAKSNWEADDAARSDPTTALLLQEKRAANPDDCEPNTGLPWGVVAGIDY